MTDIVGTDEGWNIVCVNGACGGAGPVGMGAALSG